MMIELAWMWRRHQPGSALTVWFNERLGTSKGRPRRIASSPWRANFWWRCGGYLETGLVPTGAVLKAKVSLHSPEAANHRSNTRIQGDV